MVTDSDRVFVVVSDILMFTRGDEKLLGSHAVVETEMVLDGIADVIEDCDTSVVAVTVSSVLLFTFGGE